MYKQPERFFEYAENQASNGNCQYLFDINDVTVLVDCDNYSRGCVYVLYTEYYDDKHIVHSLKLEANSQPLAGTNALNAFKHLLEIGAYGEFSFVDEGSSLEFCKFNQEKYNSIMELK